MITRHARGKTKWIDLESPSPEEVRSIVQEFGIDPRVETEMLAPTPYPLTIAFPGYAYLVLHFPISGSADGTRSQEVDFIVGKDFMVTARYEVVEPIHTLHKLLEAEELVASKILKGRSIPDLLELVMDRLYAAENEEAETARRLLERIERDIFSGKERAAVKAISAAARVLLRFETALARHEEPLGIFLGFLGTPAFFGAKFDSYAAQIEAARAHSLALIESYRAIAHELRTTNDSLLSASQNGVMKTLTILTFVTSPLTLVSSIFGMNVDQMPIVDSPGGFWIVLALMAILGLGFFLFFRIKKWL